MSVQKIIYLLISIGFMGACTHKTNYYDFESNKSTKIDESQVVLTRFPVQLEEVNDSLVAAIHSYQKISMYNIYTGKNTANFLVSDVNFDSLIENTYQKKYAGERIYHYDKKGMTDIAGMGEKTSLFQYIHNKFYIYISTLAEVEYLNDTAEFLKYNGAEKIEQLMKKTNKKLNFSKTDFVQFLFTTDDKLNVQTIIPLYEAPVFKQNNYYPIYERAFYVDGNDLHVFLLKSNEAYQTLRSKKNLSSYYTGVMDLKDETKSRLLLNNNMIDYSGFSFDDYLGSYCKFYNKNNALFYSNGKEICKVESGKIFFSGKNLKSNEWIRTLYINEEDDKVVMFTYRVDKKKNPTEFEKHYAIDSANTPRIRVFDTKTSQWIAEKAWSDSTNFPALITKNKIIYLDKDKQNYYFKWIFYNEN